MRRLMVDNGDRTQMSIYVYAQRQHDETHQTLYEKEGEREREIGL
jgi:hypothetical protein